MKKGWCKKHKALIIIISIVILALIFVAGFNSITGGAWWSMSKLKSYTPNSYVNCTDTCTTKAYTCGAQTICGKSINCGVCPAGQTCNSGKCCADTCTSKGYNCGTHTFCGKSTVCGTCTNTQTCTNGKCVTAPCTDSDNGINYDIAGQVTQAGIGHYDICDSKTGKLTEWYCNNNVMTFNTFTCFSPSICYNKVIGKSGWGNIYNYNGACCTPNCKNSDGTTKCGVDNGCGGKCPTACPIEKTCSNGICVPFSSITTCTDSDNGDYPLIKGTCVNSKGYFVDTCTNTPIKETLTEYYCNGVDCLYKNIKNSTSAPHCINGVLQ